MVIDELSGDELLFHRLFHCLASSSLSSLSSFLHASLSLFLFHRSLPQQLSTQSLLASVKLRKWIHEDSQMFCVLVHSVENEGRVEESQDKLTGEFRSDSGFVLESLESLMRWCFTEQAETQSDVSPSHFSPAVSLFGLLLSLLRRTSSGFPPFAEPLSPFLLPLPLFPPPLPRSPGLVKVRPTSPALLCSVQFLDNAMKPLAFWMKEHNFACSRR